MKIACVVSVTLYLIEILHQTTTWRKNIRTFAWLYLIEILHQTTTHTLGHSFKHALYLIEILHQTTTAPARPNTRTGCILSKFYIKPQLGLPVCASYGVVSYRNSTSNHNLYPVRIDFINVVSYRNSTSNHNLGQLFGGMNALYLIEILHQTTTEGPPQTRTLLLYLIEILHQTTTAHSPQNRPLLLYLIEILHQTTTRPPVAYGPVWLYLIEILHQTTTRDDNE